MGRDVTYYIDKGHLYRNEENDGATFLKRGPETVATCLCTTEEAKELYPEQLKKALRSSGAEHGVH